MHKNTKRQPIEQTSYHNLDNDTEEWHYHARVKLARLAEQMCKLFSHGHDAVQSPEYEEVHAQYRQLEVDIQLYDTHGEDHGKLYTHVG